MVANSSGCLPVERWPEPEPEPQPEPGREPEPEPEPDKLWVAGLSCGAARQEKRSAGGWWQLVGGGIRQAPPRAISRLRGLQGGKRALVA